MIGNYLITIGLGAFMVWFLRRMDRPLPGGHPSVKQRDASEIDHKDTFEG